MAKIAFLLLCHTDPAAVVAQARRLTAAGDCVAIHYDARAEGFEAIRAGLEGEPNVAFAARRIKCGWGEWSLVAATLESAEAALAAFPEATHLYMISGDCMAIKSAVYAHRLLEAEDVDHIEAFDFFASDWIKTGTKADRLLYRHYFNERKAKWLFYASVAVQRRLGLVRRIPDDLQVMVGSQWWCLRRATVAAVLAFLKARPDVVRFFRRTWIPDETVFQTLVPHLVPEAEIRNRPLTFLMFSDYGIPVTFYNDHYDLLLAQDYLFARKISPDAMELKRRLGDLYASGRTDFAISDEGRRLYAYTAARGRVGRRFGQRFWDTDSAIGLGRSVLIVTCRKYHVAKRLAGSIQAVTGIPALHFLFDEEDAGLPDLGGIEASIAKRTRHRRALMRMLFDYYDTDKLVVCLDPGQLPLMLDFEADRSVTRVLEIDVAYSDSYLAEHARRVGLAGEGTPAATMETLIATLRADIAFETGQLRGAEMSALLRLREGAAEAENAGALARFLDIPRAEAQKIARTDNLFAD